MSKNYVEEQVTINGEVQLKGTLTLPESTDAKLPAILIVNGSGGANRDGDIPKPSIKAGIYKDLAYLVTELGFISLRYDKRGIGESQGNAKTAGVKDLVNDIVSNVKFLKDHPKVDSNRIILIGHSEGCILSTIANSIEPVAGLVLIAGAGTNLREPILYQNAQVIEEVKRTKGLKGMLLRLALSEARLNKQQDELYNLMLNSTGDTVKYKMQKLPAKWFREHFEVSTEEVLNHLRDAKCKIMAVTGDKDVQARHTDLERIEALGNNNITCRVIKNMDHMMKEFSGEKTVIEIMKQYKKEVEAPMHPELKTSIENWLSMYK